MVVKRNETTGHKSNNKHSSTVTSEQPPKPRRSVRSAKKTLSGMEVSASLYRMEGNKTIPKKIAGDVSTLRRRNVRKVAIPVASKKHTPEKEAIELSEKESAAEAAGESTTKDPTPDSPESDGNEEAVRRRYPRIKAKRPSRRRSNLVTTPVREPEAVADMPSKQGQKRKATTQPSPFVDKKSRKGERKQDENRGEDPPTGFQAIGEDGGKSSHHRAQQKTTNRVLNHTSVPALAKNADSATESISNVNTPAVRSRARRGNSSSTVPRPSAPRNRVSAQNIDSMQGIHNVKTPIVRSRTRRGVKSDSSSAGVSRGNEDSTPGADKPAADQSSGGNKNDPPGQELFLTQATAHGDPEGQKLLSTASSNSSSGRSRYYLSEEVFAEEATSISMDSSPFALPVDLSAMAKQNVMTDLAVIADRFDVLKVLGSGAFACVFQARSLADGEVYALKWMDGGVDQNAMIEVEASFLERLQGIPGIVGYHGLVNGTHGSFLIMEHCEGSDLKKHVEKNGAFDETAGQIILTQLLETINGVHADNVIHRDIKPPNIVLFIDSSGSLTIKLLDLGMCFVLEPGVALRSKSGTEGYWAPEVFDEASPYFANGYTSKADMYSTGCTLFFLLRGRDYDATVSDSDKWDGLSYWAADFIKNLTDLNPAARMSAEEALMHPFIAGENFNSIRQAIARRAGDFCKKNVSTTIIVGAFLVAAKFS